MNSWSYLSAAQYANGSFFNTYLFQCTSWQVQNPYNQWLNYNNYQSRPWNYSYPKSKPKTYSSWQQCSPSAKAPSHTTLSATSADEKMEAKKYYGPAKFGEYYVHFSNKTAIPRDEVGEIFRQFSSDVRNISQTGNGTGLCFVNFRTAEDAERVVEALRDHDTIKLREVDPARWSQHNDQSNNKSSYNNNKHKNSEGWAGWNKNGTRRASRDDVNKEAAVTNNSQNLEVNNNEETKTIEKVESSKEEEVETGTTEVIKETVSVSQQMPELISALEQWKNVENRGSTSSVAVDSTIMMNSSLNSLSEAVIEAQEVIVANVDKSYGSPFILYLFEKYQPISVSAIKVISAHSLRYCHVYFKTMKQAQAVQNTFDNTLLANKKLIVLTTDSLASLSA